MQVSTTTNHPFQIYTIPPAAGTPRKIRSSFKNCLRQFLKEERIFLETIYYAPAALICTVLVSVKNSMAAVPCSRECELDDLIPPNGACGSTPVVSPLT